MKSDDAIQGFDIPSSILDRWRALWAQAERPTPNAQPDRFLATARALGSEPVVLELTDADGRCGMVVGRKGRIRVSGHVCYLPIRPPELDTLAIVYGGILGNASPPTLARRILELLDNSYEHIMISALHVDSPYLEALRHASNALILPAATHWIMELSKTWAETISRHSRTHRKNLRRIDKKIFSANGNAKVRVFESPHEVREFVEIATDISQHSYQDAGGGGFPCPHIWKAVLEAEADSNRLRCYVLFKNGVPISYQSGTLYGGIFYGEGRAYCSEMASLRPGTVLFMRVAQDLCERGVDLIDFGFGHAEHKRIYGTRSWQESTVHIYTDSLSARVARAAQIANIQADKMFRIFAGSSARDLKKKWRRHRDKGSRVDPR